VWSEERLAPSALPCSLCMEPELQQNLLDVQLVYV
jgi:hypothetical protein